MTQAQHRAVTIWFDPVCPFSWHTARWLREVAGEVGGLAIDWRLMSLAVLNEGRELPAPQQARMHDSQRIGRLMAAIRHKRGAEEMAAAYFAFGERYIEQSHAIDDSLVAAVLSVVGSYDIDAAVLSDTTQDDLVRDSHQAGQDALGESGGSPIVQIDGQTFFGPVLSGPPAPQMRKALFDAVATLAAVPQFSQLQRPRTTG
jgi:2-hydroxychromene-2-carboxylate isomerase